MKNEEIETKASKKGLKSGIVYGLLPHAGCIAFILFSLVGVTSITYLFRPLLLNSYFFYILIGLSFIFATVSAIFYLTRSKGCCSSSKSLSGKIRSEWKYLSTLYGATIIVNILLFTVIFPLTANLASANYSPQDSNTQLSSLTLKVEIPCSGHASLISGDLKGLDGVADVKFRFPNYFDISYDSSKISQDKILSLDIFNTYKASVV